MIKVGVVGALGKMGKEVVKAVLNAEDTELVMAVDILGEGADAGLAATNKECGVKIETDLEKAIKNKKPDVIVDFTQPSGIYNHVCTYMQYKVKSVIGTTGLKDEQITNLEKMSKENNTACLIAPNFSTGAVLLMMFAKQAAKYFNNAEIIELHHNQKKDAPSGTAIKTAQLMAEENSDFTLGNCPETELIEGSRGGTSEANIHIHSVRMPGYIASQEVIFGASGQILKLAHHTMERSCYMAGVLLAVRYVFNNNEFIYGLDNIMQ
ncbi:MAG: 4-hydroxy-tetrahydrodipicolinate reductase [Candidatus Gastranaerophilales bacterium]|nr:4-hydroxy-tetrahydrodipicolinate reductase [Candidatus Gastranaerophilales bacterium]